MKNITGKIVKIFAGAVLLLLILLIAIPILFKDKIKTKVVDMVNQSVNATVTFGDYKLGFFRNFPNLTFSITNLSVVGKDKFSTDTLADISSFDMVLNLSSLFKKSGYEIKTIIIDHAALNVRYLNDGSANYDIMKETAGTSETSPATSAPAVSSPVVGASSGMKVLLKRVAVTNSSVTYFDESLAMKTWLNDFSLTMSGDMTASETELKIMANSGEFTYLMDGVKYLNKTVAEAKLDMHANLDKWSFTFGDDYLIINDLKVNFKGTVDMPGDDITTNIEFHSEKSDLKSLMSLIPSVYMSDYKDLRTSGEFALSGKAVGVYSDADSTLPNVNLNFTVSNGLISYPSLPEQIKNINVKSEIYYDGTDDDKTTVAIDPFHMELAGNPFDMSLYLKTPMSDPDIKGSMKGRIDLASLSKAIPMDSISLSGLIDMSVQMAGRMSMIDKGQYDKFSASGTMGIKNMLVAMTGYPEVKINSADFGFTPAFATLSNGSMNLGGKSDFALTGRLENYIPYVFNDKTLKGNLSLRSRVTDVTEIMSAMSSGTSEVKSAGTVTADAPAGKAPADVSSPAPAVNETALALIKVPENLDFDFDALIDELRYDKINARNVKGHLIVRNGILSVKDAAMNILGGLISMNADYDTRDTLKPTMKASFGIQNIGVKDAFDTFNSVQKLAPAAQGIDGKINLTLDYQSLLGKDMMPVINSISGAGKVQSDEITLVKSATFDKMKEVLKLGDKYNNVFKNVTASFRIDNGRIYVNPFDVKTGNLRMNISGDQGIDQTINYFVKTEIPRSDLGSSVNSLIDNISAQAASFGISFKPSEVLKVNVSVTGTFSKPIVAPVFGKSMANASEGEKAAIKETVGQAIGTATDKAKEKASAEAQAEAARLIKEAESKGQTMREEAADAAAKMRKEADVQAQKLIDDASTKNTLTKMAAQKGADAIRKTADANANKLVKETDVQATKLVDEAKVKSDELVKKIN